MTQPLSLLLVDPDPDGLEILTFGFEREGANVTASSDVAAAPTLVGAAAPSLVVVRVRPSDPSALEAIRRMRTGAHAIPHLAVLALGPLEQRDAVLAAGASEFLATPTFIRDIVNASKLARSGRRAPGQDEGQGDARLSDYRGVYYLLRAMSAAGGSAVLRLERGSRRAELRVSEGRLLAANVDSLQGLPALHHTLLWEQAALSIRLGSVGKRNQLNLSTQEVLDESERFLRDFAHAARDLGPSTTVYGATAAGGATPGLQSSQAAPLLRLCDGSRNLADVIAESPFRIFDTLRMIKRLRDSGALAARAPAPSGDRAPANGVTGGSMLGEWAMVPDLRGVVGDRRGPSRTLRSLTNASTNASATPIAGPAPEPAVLAYRQGTSTAREIVPGQPPAPQSGLAVAPTVRVRVDVDGTPLTAPAPMSSAASAPIPGARAARQPTPIQLRTRADQAARSRLDSTPPPQIQRPPTGPHPRLERGPAARPGRSTGPQPQLERTPPPRANRLPSGSHPELERTPPPRGNKSSTGPQPILERAPPPRAGKPASGPQPMLERAPQPRAGKPASGSQPRLERAPSSRGSKPGSGPHARLERTPPPRASKPPSGPQPTLATAFDDVEADFFAREADLYKRDALETFDDLDHPLGPSPGNKSRSRKK